MFLEPSRTSFLEIRFPHAGGDVSGHVVQVVESFLVFPTQVGMFPRRTT